MDAKSFRNPAAEFRGVALWMLNDKLELDEILRQFDGIAAAGWGAVIGRTFNGLRTEYLSDEWMEIIAAIIGRAKELGLRVWLQAGYMPSGMPDVPPDWVHRGLSRRPKGDLAAEGEATLVEDDEFVYALRSEGSVLDLLNAKAVAWYLDRAYKDPWHGRFGNEFGETVEAIWVDEPHFRPPLLPWSEHLPKEFRRQWGYDLVEHVPSLYRTEGDYRKVRHHYWRTVLGMFIEAYFRPVARWCGEHDVKFSGHLMGEDTLNNQIAWTGAAMPCYEWMHLPGIDHLTMSLLWPAKKKFLLTPKQMTSVGSQLGKDELLCEMYGVSSQAISFEDRKQIANWMAVLGVNCRCYHGAFYSMRGRRKRIYVPHLSYQQPWWSDNHLVADHFARLSYVLRQGTTRADVLVIHPVESVMGLYDPTTMGRPHDRSTEAEDVKNLDDRLVALCDHLMQIHRPFDFGDETLLSRHGKASADGLTVGQMTYRTVVLPDMLTIRASTVKLLEAFVAAGGTVLAAGRLPERVDGVEGEGLGALAKHLRPVANEPAALKAALDAASPPDVEVLAVGGGSAKDIWVHVRDTDAGRIVFLTNTSRERGVRAEVKICGAGRLECWDLDTGDVCQAAQRCEGICVVAPLSFAPLGSHLLVLKEGESADVRSDQWSVVRTVELPERLALNRCEPNALTLDICRLRKGDSPWTGPLPVIAVQAMLDKEQYRGPVALEFGFRVADVPKRIAVAVEDAERFAIRVNGKSVRYTGLPYYMDRSFHPVDITSAVRKGENTIALGVDFEPIPPSRFALAGLFENKPGVELESIYLIGDFAVRGNVSPRPARPRCVRLEPDMVLAAEPGDVGPDLAADGYPCYAGRVTLSASVEMSAPGDGERVVLELPALDAALAKVRVNGKAAREILWPPYETDVTEFIRSGGNEVEIELVGTLRNLLGPHHRSSGEPDNCWRTAFDYNPGAPGGEHAEELESTWTDDYLFVHFGLGGCARIKYLSPA